MIWPLTMTTTPGINQLKVLFDSDGVIAMAKPDDPSHQRSQEIFDFLAHNQSQFFIASTTLAEVLTTLQRRFGDKKTAENSYEDLVAGKIEVVTIGADLIKDAYQYYKESKSKKNTIFDAINIAVMKSLSLDAIFSFDGWYEKHKIRLAEKFL